MLTLKIYLIKYFILLQLFAVSISNPCFAQSIVKSLDNYISTYYENGYFNGCILVAEKGNIIFEKSYGYTDYTASTKLTTDYQFRLASVSKQFTAMAIMILKERGALRYDNKVNIYLKDFPYNNISIRNLLNHTSGLPDYGDLLEQYREVDTSKNRGVSNKDVYNLLIKYHPPQEFYPGDEHKYCNMGYVVLALLIEEITHQSFQNFLSENIFSPLGMKSSYVNPSTGQLNNHHRAKGFTNKLNGTGYIAYDWNYQNGMYGDGGVISTLQDLLLWDKGLRSEMLVKHTTLQEAFTQVILNDGSTRENGFGWSVIKQESDIIVAHGGSWLGYTTGILRDLSTNQTVIQLCNMPSKRVIFPVWDILNGREVIVPEFVNVTFVVEPKVSAIDDSIYITGNHTKLGNWHPAKILLDKMSSNRWQRTISIEKDFELEYKVTRGSWEKEAVYEPGITPGNFVIKVQQDTLIEIQVPYWKDSQE